MNTIMTYRSVKFMIIVVLLCIALLVMGVLLLHDSLSAAQMVKHGIMNIQPGYHYA